MQNENRSTTEFDPAKIYTDWLSEVLAEIESPQKNAREREKLEGEFLQAVCAKPLTIPLVIGQLQSLTHFRYASKLASRLASEERLARSIRKMEEVPSPNEVSTLFESYSDPVSAQKILADFIAYPSYVFERDFEKISKDFSEFGKLVMNVGYSLVASLSNVTDKPASASKLFEFIYEDARGAKTNSLTTFIAAASRNSDEGLAREAGALEEVLLLLMETFSQQDPKELITIFTQRFTPELAQLVDQKKYQNGFILQWQAIAKSLKEYRNDPEGTFGLVLPFEDNLIIDLANHLLVSMESSNIPDEEQLDIWNVQMPDGGVLFLAQQKSADVTTRLEEMKLYLTSYFGAQKNTQTLIVENAEIRRFIVEALVPQIEKDKLLEEVSKHRERAAGGFSTISERGDKVKILEKGSAEETYLSSLGIKACTLYQTGNGIRIELHWFSCRMDFQLNDKYELLNPENMNDEAKLWLEDLFLHYVADIKNQLAETEPTKQHEGAGFGRVFAGRRPHLRVLPLSHKSSIRMPEYRGESVDDETIYLEELHRFILFHFGVSLETLNNLFESVQEDISLHKNSDFQTLFELYESNISPEYRALAGWQNAKAIIKEALRRSVKKDTRVRFSRTHGVLRQNNEGFEQTKERFQITLVNEAKSQSLDIQPMTFVCDGVSQEMAMLEAQ